MARRPGPARAEIMMVGEQPGDHAKPNAAAQALLVTAAVHPSSILRAPDDASRRLDMRGLVADLRKIAKTLATRSTT